MALGAFHSKAGRSIVFGAAHERWAPGTAAGLAFAAARLRRGRLSDAVLAPAVANAGVASAGLLHGALNGWPR